MSDEQIRQILIEKKKFDRQMKREERTAKIIDIAENILAWGGLFFIGFMISIVG